MLRPEIQRVAQYLRNCNGEDFAKHYSPKLVSIGPIHHGNKNLQLGEKYKLMWAAMYIESTCSTPEALHQSTADNIKELKNLFSEDAIGEFEDKELSWMLFVDGCCLLQMLDNAKLDDPEKMKIKVDQLAQAMQDVVLLENQLPFQVLKLLSPYKNEAQLVESMSQFLHCHHLSPHGRTKGSQSSDINKEVRLVMPLMQQGPPTHLLDFLYKTILPPCNNPKMNQKQDEPEEYDMKTYRNIQELNAAGMAVKKSKTSSLRDISFSCGWLLAKLNLPKIVVDDTTAPTFLNLIKNYVKILLNLFE